MTRKEQKIEKRAYEIYSQHDDWCWVKALSAAIAEDYKRGTIGGTRKFSVRAFGWLEYTWKEQKLTKSPANLGALNPHTTKTVFALRFTQRVQRGIIALLLLPIVQRAQRALLHYCLYRLYKEHRGHYYIITQSAFTHYHYKCNLLGFIILWHGSVNRTSDPLTFCQGCAIISTWRTKPPWRHWHLPMDKSSTWCHY